MNNLVKIREVSSKYNITARALRYYEDMGILNSTRSEGSTYRMYDEEAVRRIEQILILRKLNISIKDIQLNELKGIVLDFIEEIEKMNFSDNADIKQLYNKAKDIETQIVNVDYIGKPANINRLIEITDKLDKKVPDVMVIRIPSFRAVTSGERTFEEIFKKGGYMFQLWQHFPLYRPVIFDCLDFMLVNEDKATMICAVKEGVSEADVSPLELIDFPGGLYAMAVSIDEDDESIQKVQDKIFQWVEGTNFEVDKARNFMFNMPYLDEENAYQKDIEKGLGYRQMQRYVPIRLKDGL